MNPVSWIQETKRIHGICPCCGEIFRLSEATIYTREPPPKTDFDRVQASRERLERVIEKFEGQWARLQEAAHDRGQRAAQRRLRQIAPEFVGRGIDPREVKVLFDPVRYVVFRGLRGTGVDAIEFVDEEPDSKPRERLLRSLAQALVAGNVEWSTWRVDEDGVVTAGP